MSVTNLMYFFPSALSVSEDLSKIYSLILSSFPFSMAMIIMSPRPYSERIESFLSISQFPNSEPSLNRFCAAEGLENVEVLSDFRGNFGEDYGVTLDDSPLRGLLSRAVVVLDETGKVIYAEQVPEIGQEPNYAEAVNALK